MPKVVAVLLNWNGWPDTINCLRSLDAITYSPLDFIVVDNHSDDDSVLKIRSAYPHLTVLENDADRGFAGGCNPGILAALAQGADYVWLLNTDAIADPDALTHMVFEAESQADIGAVGSVIHFMAKPSKIQAWGGGRVDEFRGSSKEFTSRPGANSLHYITGASLLMKRAALESVGLLDEQFFMYWEDTDWCARARKAGWRLCVADDAKIFHKCATSFGGHRQRSSTFEKLFNESAVRFFRKWSPNPTLPILFGLSARTLHRLCFGRVIRAAAVFRVLLQVLRESRGSGRDLLDDAP